MRSIKPRDVFLSFFLFLSILCCDFYLLGICLVSARFTGERQTRSKKKFTATWFLSRAEHLGKRL